MGDVEGMASENKLAMLNLAASMLGPEEAYVEVGSWKGLSIIAAMLDNPGSRFYAIENFHGFGMDRDKGRAELEANVRRWELHDRLMLVERNALEALARPGWLSAPVGVFFYDGSHDRLAQYVALGLVEPLLAEEALVVIDDTDWRPVGASTDRYVARHSGYQLLFELSGGRESDQRWWNGVRVYRYRRVRRPARTTDLDLAWRRGVYLWAYEPAARASTRAAKRVLRGRPRLTAVTLRVASAVGSRLKGRVG